MIRANKKVQSTKRNIIKLKKGQLIGEIFKYILIGLFSILILIWGYKMVNTVKERACKAEISKFEIDLRDINKGLRFGTKELKNYPVPCKVEELYFFDLNKKVNPEYFNDTPILKDALQSAGNDNIFLVKEGNVKSSFYTGNLEIVYPHYICFIPKFDVISFFIEGTGKSAKVVSTVDQPECTLIPVNISQNEAENIINEAVNFGCSNCPSYPDTEKQNIEQTRKNAEIFRKFTLKDKKTKVEIIISPRSGVRLGNFKFYEFIPKTCIDDLQNYIEERIDDDANVDIKADPLIIWSFSEIKKQKKVSYKLKKELDSECRQLIKGLAVAQSIENLE